MFYLKISILHLARSCTSMNLCRTIKPFVVSRLIFCKIEFQKLGREGEDRRRTKKNRSFSNIVSLSVL
ncbi:hypothetical protein O6P43_004011 [Quillaja saponaria]|uniref:Uncharacterized protein n=1 Tax=Quillaja saponaria TaxID=32244 RepID=A0AAD7VFQ1_QUISA|nr:hypothetical protein O6P43_004011 [Quillaja saponaria]